MSSRSSGPANRPALVVLCALLLGTAIAVIAAATANAAQYKMVMCAGNNGVAPYTVETDTISAANPSGIFEFHNWCGGAGSDPPGEAAFLRVNENQAAGNAGQGAYGDMIFATPPFVHFKAAGGFTREPNAFNDGWRARFWAGELSGYQTELLAQGAGLPNSGTQWATTGSFAPHLWPFGSFLDFNRFAFSLTCVKPYGCDRANYNAADANGFVLILSDNSDPQIGFSSYNPGLIQGAWVRGVQGMIWDVSDQGSGLRDERLWVDGAQRYAIDNACDLGSSPANGEYARSYQPCPAGGPWRHGFDLDTGTFADGAHSLSICAQDYGQYQGLNGTGGQTCDSRTIHTDNTAPGAPLGLQVTSANPARYLDHFGAQFSLPADPGSPIAKVHYDVINAEGAAVTPAKVLSGTNPTQVSDIGGPAKAGEYRLKVWLEDEVGLTGPAATVPIPHDTTPPAAPQDLSVTAPDTKRTAQAFDVRWRDIPDGGSPVDAAHYEVLDGAGRVVVPAQTVTGDPPQAIAAIETPHERGSYTLRLWLSDAEGNAGAPVSAPLSYECARSDAGGGLTLTAGLGKHTASSLVVQQNESATLNGELTGVGGQIPNAPLCIFSKVVTDQTRQFLGVAMTGPDGDYQFAIGSGPSREVTAAYRPDQRELTQTATLKTRVHPTLKLRGKVVKNKGFAIFTGSIPGPDNAEVLLVLQVKSGKEWRVFRRYRTHEGGHFLMRYRFTQTFTPTTYIMRAQLRKQSGYPYEEGNSRAIPVLVEP